MAAQRICDGRTATCATQPDGWSGAHFDTATIPLPGPVGAPFRARPVGMTDRHRARKGAVSYGGSAQMRPTVSICQIDCRFRGRNSVHLINRQIMRAQVTRLLK